jgi:transcriptional regulator with XRE-family HTH domain
LAEHYHLLFLRRNTFGYSVLVKVYDARSIGRRVAGYRRANRMSAEQLAARVGGGLTRAAVTKLENGYRVDLSSELLVEIAFALRIPPIALLLPLDDPQAVVITETDPHGTDASTEWTVLDQLKLAQGWQTQQTPPAAFEAQAQLAALRAYIALETSYADALYDVTWPNEDSLPEAERRARLDAAQVARDAQIVTCRRLGIAIPDEGLPGAV